MALQDWIPPALSRKASAAARAVYLLSGGRVVWTPRDFEKLAREGFENNVTVYSCVMEVARSAAGIPWVLYQKGRGRRQLIELDDHALLSLMARPNPRQGQAAFIEAATAYLLLSGNNYIEAVGPSENAPPMELWTLRPDRVRVLPDLQNHVGGYRYTAGSTHQDFAFDQVLHQLLFSPVDDWYGLAPLVVAARAVDSDNAAQKWNVALLQNQARPSGALISKQNLGDQQFASLKEQIDERYSGPSNAGRPLLLEGDMDWKQFSLNPADMDWLAGRKMAKLEICQVFGVPPELIGDHEHATYSNFQEARKAFYQETVLPYMDRLRDALNNWLVPKFGDRLYLDYDRDEIEALQEERQKVWTSAIDGVKAGVITPNEAREKMGYETRPEGNVLLVSAAMLPLGSSSYSEEEEPAAKEAGDLRRFVKAFGLSTEEAKSMYWKKVDRTREAWAGKLASQIRALLEGDAKAAAKAVKDAPAGGETEAAEKALRERRADWERTLTATYIAVIELFGETTQEGLKAGAPRRQVKAFDVFTQRVRNYVANTVASRIKGILDTTVTRVRSAIAAGVDEGEGTDELAARVQETFQGFTAARAQTIARTEVISASNFGSQEAAKQTGLRLKKEWIATRDGRERESHGSLDGQLVKMDSPYPNGLMFPGDPAGGPEEVINCRCAEGYHVDEDEA